MSGAVYAFEVRTLAAQPVASIIIPGIQRAGVGAALGGALPDVYSHLVANGVAMVAPPFARYHEGDDNTLDLEAGIPVAGTFPETDTIKARQLPGGDVIATVHSGSYHRLHEAVAALAEWRLANGRVASGPFWEIYLDDPTEVEPDALRTEVVEPLAPKIS